MNKFFVILGIFLVCIGCKKETPIDYAIFSGNIENTKIDKFTLIGGNLTQEIKVSEEGVFRDTIEVDSAGYFHFNLKESSIELYLQPGSNIDLTADLKDKNKSITYTGKGAKENNFLITKKEVRKKLNDSIRFYQFFYKPVPLKENSLLVKNKITKILDTTTTIDAAFKEKELHHNQLNYLTTLYTYVGYPENDSLPKNYFDGFTSIGGLDTIKYATISDYNALVQAFYDRKQLQLSDILRRDKEEGNLRLKSFLTILEELPNGAIKDDFMSNNSSFILSPIAEDIDVEKVFPVLMTSSNVEDKEKYKNKYSRLKKLSKGNPSPVFEYENYKGGTSALADFKGNYVFIDIWATWCKPCIAQFPYIKDLKKKYKNKNIKFVGISIDDPRDKSKWQTLIQKKNLENSIQLYAGTVSKSDFMKEYFLVADSYSVSIPRFILIDPNGNIVDRNAPQALQTQEIEKLFSELDI